MKANTENNIILVAVANRCFKNYETLLWYGTSINHFTQLYASYWINDKNPMHLSSTFNHTGIT